MQSGKGTVRILQIIKKFEGILTAAASVLIALLIGSIVLLASGINPIAAYGALMFGAFGNMRNFFDTLGRATPIIFTGLAIGFAFRGGMFNIGAEGQLAAGALCAAIVGYALKVPMIIHLPLSILAGMAGGMAWAAIPAVLRAKKGVHEVISTIMMNYIAVHIGGFMIEKLRTNEMPQTPDVLPTARLLKVSELFESVRNTNLNMGFVIAVICAIILYIVINKTVFGYELRAMGFSPLAAEDAGISLNKKIITVMLLSGMFAGLAGTERVLGVHRTYLSGISTNFGFEGIAVALLAKNNPVGIIFSAILFGALSSGGQYMSFETNASIDIVGIIQGLIILFAAISQAGEFINFKKLFRSRKNETQDGTLQAAKGGK